MIDRAYTASLFALYQLSIAAGIVLMPLALAMRQLGVSLPIHRVVESLGTAYDEANAV
ncbi:hypothetical protein [Haloarchaeobius salinus]|uniref:hypothetical protein n=1 Tax=Haloarchaeobius salinus TaxID=1198298 RepID=UPI00210B94F5|nr:hypothetical protein [Haloarchaeobius salinus]